MDIIVNIARRRKKILLANTQEEEEPKMPDKTFGYTMLIDDQLPDIQVLPNFGYGSHCYDVTLTPPNGPSEVRGEL